MALQQVLYGSAAAASLLSLAAHAFLGGRLIARPVLSDASVTLAYRLPFLYCWHFVTLSLAGLATGFAFLAAAPEQWLLAIFLTANAIAGSLLAIVIAKMESVPPVRLPPTLLFALIAALGAAGIISRRFL